MELKDFFTQHPRLALAFSGGVDSSYLLYAAKQYDAEVGVYYVSSAFQPAFERADALRLARSLDMPVTVLPLDVLACPEVTANPADRCYHCKRHVMSTIKAAAARDGYDLVIDGTNASDNIGDRPGWRALEEEGVLSPLRLCGLTKPMVRSLSKEAGLFTWDKPAYACLATRVKTGQPITAETLAAVEAGESALFDLGFSDFRVRTADGKARLEFTADQLDRARGLWGDICARLSPWFSDIILDPAGREKSV